MRINAYLAKSAVVAALGGLLFGFDTAVISGTTGALTTTYGLTPSTLGLTVAAALWGTITGAMFGGVPGDPYGRRASLRITGILVPALRARLRLRLQLVLVRRARFIGGLGIGGSSVLGPMYIAEIAPPRIRGRLVGMFQFNVVFGILLAYFSNYLIGALGFGAEEWRWKLGVAGVPGGPVLPHAVRHPAKPALAGRGGALTEAARGAAPHRRAGLSKRRCAIVASIDENHGAGGEPLFSREVPAARSSWPSPSACSTSSPASTRFSIT